VGRSLGLEDGPVPPHRCEVVRARVVEGGPALDVEVHPPAHHADVANEPVAGPGDREYRHEVDDLSHPFRRQEAGEENVGIGQVELLAAGVFHRAEAEVPALLVVEDGAEDARGLEGG
jgi:hypothetical protein